MKPKESKKQPTEASLDVYDAAWEAANAYVERNPVDVKSRPRGFFLKAMLAPLFLVGQWVTLMGFQLAEMDEVTCSVPPFI